MKTAKRKKSHGDLFFFFFSLSACSRIGYGATRFVWLLYSYLKEMCANAKQLKIQSLLCLCLYSYSFWDSKLCAYYPLSLLPCHPTVQTPVSWIQQAKAFNP